MSRWSVVLTAVLSFLFPALVTAQAKVIKIGLGGDFSSSYASSSPEYSAGQRDYLSLVNVRGGVGGYTLEGVVVDHGNQPQRGLEMYERFKNEGMVVADFLSTPVVRAIVTRAMQDKLPVITPFHGRSDGVDGVTFPYLFPLSPGYWAQAAGIVKFIQEQEKGSLKGKKIAFVGYDSPFGKEPQPVLESLASSLGFEYQAFYYPVPGNEQSGVWTQVRRFRPDWTLIWGAGTAQAVSLREIIRNAIRLDRVVSNVWMTESETAVVGNKESTGIMRFEGVASGRDVPVFQAILKEVVEKGRGAGPAEKVGRTHYAMGAASMAVVVEGIRLALQKEGAPLTPEKVKRGLEQIRNFDPDGLMPKMTITAEDHAGGSQGRVSQWDGTRWVPKSEWSSAFQEVVWKQIKASAADFRNSTK